MPSVRSLAVAIALGLALAMPRATRAQGDSTNDAYARAEALELRDDYAAAADAYREALARDPVSVPAILGLERVYAQLGRPDSMLALISRTIPLAPRLSVLRAAQLRTLRTLGDREGMRAAFDRWRGDAPGDPGPYREYARILLQDGFTQQADTVLREAQAALGSGRTLTYELAQLRAAMGLWELAARAWRQTVTADAHLDRAAAFSLIPTPVEQRDAVRRALAAAPPTLGPIAVLAQLELAWGSPQAGWDALRTIRPDTAAVSAWLDYARRAEEANAWLVARDALVAANAVQPSPALAARAAGAAMSGGDAAGAVELAEHAERALDPAVAARSVLPVHLRALSTLGKPAEGERLLANYAARLDPDERARYTRLIAWGWVRRGDLGKARELLAQSGEGDQPTEGWLALYEGDLAAARERLRPTTTQATPELLTALALLERTRADRAPEVGSAFLTLARGDTLAAATAFEHSSRTLPEVGSLLLLTAARLYTAHGAPTKALPLWETIVRTMPEAPEAPEAELDWARALRHDGQTSAAIERLEHLILTYPQSALVPQARRELELARSAVPPTS